MDNQIFRKGHWVTMPTESNYSQKMSQKFDWVQSDLLLTSTAVQFSIEIICRLVLYSILRHRNILSGVSICWDGLLVTEDLQAPILLEDWS